MNPTRFFILFTFENIKQIRNRQTNKACDCFLLKKITVEQNSQSANVKIVSPNEFYQL